jgi:hypothetical protein
MTLPTHAIQTHYAGCRFRSRLEARWAVYFDSLGWSWQYEPEGFHLPGGDYLPDFHVEHRGFCPCDSAFCTRLRREWYEIKGSTPTPHELQLVRELAVATGQQVVLLTGDIPRPGVMDSSSMGIRMRYPSGELIPEEIFFFLDGGDKDDLVREPKYRAAIAARSARFEHGESG